MKRISVVALILAAALSLFAFVSCGEKEEVKAPDGMKLASGEDVDYYMYVPETWRVDRSDLYTSVTNIFLTMYILSSFTNIPPYGYT